jgi:hypothetical protein
MESSTSIERVPTGIRPLDDRADSPDPIGRSLDKTGPILPLPWMIPDAL